MTTFSDLLTFSRSGSATYVDSTGTLQTAEDGEPRTGHHVWNGSQWVNEGLLLESESRTNLVEYSEDFTPVSTSTWFQAPVVTLTHTADVATGPDGLASADSLIEVSGENNRFGTYDSVAFTAAAHTLSVYVKNASGSRFVRLSLDTSGASNFVYATFNPRTGEITQDATASSESTAIQATAEDVGDGWYRVSVSGSLNPSGSYVTICLVTSGTSAAGTDYGYESYTGDGTSGVYLWGAQLEAGSTPSSYIPTNGSTVTRAAETLTAPSANLPWWTDNIVYTSDELVTNGTFDTDLTGWTTTGGTFQWESGVVGRSSTNVADYFYQTINTEIGAVYQISIDVNSFSFAPEVRVGTSGTILKGIIASVGVQTFEFTATQTTHDVGVNVVLADIEFDNISVREIETPAISIAMEGTMTYADTGNTDTVFFYDWRETSDDRMAAKLDTDVGEGQITVFQSEGGVIDLVDSGVDVYSPGVNVQFSIASRHGSTFINGAVDGTALTENTTPTALPDLSSTDLEIAPDFMGTIKSLRIWNDDLGDSGIEKASS